MCGKVLKEIIICGLRGFSAEKKVNFAIPNGEKGSGLTILVGGNNTGKTTIIEAIKYYNFDVSQISFSSGKRNQSTEGKVHITYVNEEGEQYTIHTKKTGGSQVETDESPDFDTKGIPYILPSRRSVQYELNYGFYDSFRWDYINNENVNNKVRKPTIENFQQRIFKWEKQKESFNKVLYKILDNNLEWYINQNDNGNYFLAFKSYKSGVHTSEGIGDGIWSIFTIADALYDAEKGGTIVIDEPELSLHPQYQKRVMKLLLEESANKQVIISTHSPYFISWEALENKGIINRSFKNKDGEIDVTTLSDENVKFICNTVRDYHNPHLWGMDAKEIFFLEDNIIIVEGQEDVISFNKLIKELDFSINASFFGWGAGGAGKIESILHILDNLGYERVMAIYDGDKTDEYEKCKEKYKQYNIVQIWKDDIRDKEEKTIPYKEGVLNKHFKIKEGTEPEIKDFLEEVKDYFLEQ